MADLLSVAVSTPAIGVQVNGSSTLSTSATGTLTATVKNGEIVQASVSGSNVFLSGLNSGITTIALHDSGTGFSETIIVVCGR